jgi:hypothetical protein
MPSDAKRLFTGVGRSAGGRAIVPDPVVAGAELRHDGSVLF